MNIFGLCIWICQMECGYPRFKHSGMSVWGTNNAAVSLKGDKARVRRLFFFASFPHISGFIHVVEGIYVVL